MAAVDAESEHETPTEAPTETPTTTRDKLLRAALHLFARQGLDVPLRDINELAGQRNASALHYHFGGRPELVKAIIDRYRLSDEQHTAIEAELRAGPHDIREVVEGLVDRSCAWLATPDGRDYIRVVFQFVIRLPLRQTLLEGTEPPSLASVRAQADLIHEALPELPERLVRERAVASFDLVLLQVAERARIIDDEDGRGLLPEHEWKANLIDMATGLLTYAPTAAS
jgi:AcrR family transcriptional regulator